MTEPVQLCTAGYFCTGKSIEAAPIGQAYGDKCPTGRQISTLNQRYQPIGIKNRIVATIKILKIVIPKIILFFWAKNGTFVLAVQ